MMLTMSTSDRLKLSAMDFVRDSRPTLDTAAEIASAAIRLLTQNPDTNVLIDVRKLRGVSSSFFNTIFQAVNDLVGDDAVRSRIHFDTVSEVQQSLIARSRLAVLGDSDT